MAINKKFIHFNKKTSFETELKNKNILDTSICFIKDTHEIYTHGLIYACVPPGGTIGQVLAWESDGKAKWEDVTNLLTGLENILAYGVEFNSTSQSDPHLTRIGNKAMHQYLPIQSLMRGCIAQGGKIMYWLNKKDWRFREEPVTIQVTITVDTLFSVYAMTSTTGEFANNRYAGSYIKIKRSGQDDLICQIAGVASNKAILHQATMAKTTITTGTYTIELGSVLNGYDGTVKVYVPEFYIKSETYNSKSRVWLSTTKIDNTWTHQPELLVDAYRCTVLNTVPSNMGYLSTLPINSAISVVNSNDYCRGSMNRSANDQYVATNPCQSDLCKPISNLKLETMRLNASRAGANLMNYEQYKNIFYWLYVVEYANFNCQEAFNDALTSTGYKQGGLGNGVTNVDTSLLLNWGITPITPCGYGNDLGNGTGVKDLSLTYNSSTLTYSVPRWRGFDNPFGDFCICLDGALSVIESSKRYLYICSDTSKYSNTLNGSYVKRAEIVTSSGYIKQFTLGTKADIIPRAIGGSPTTYMCDLNTTNSSTTPTVLIVGGTLLQGLAAGLSAFVTGTQDNNSITFRTVSTPTNS